MNRGIYAHDATSLVWLKWREQQQSADFGMAGRARDKKSSVTLVIGGMNVRAVVEQQLHHFPVACCRRSQERRIPGASVVHISTGMQSRSAISLRFRKQAQISGVLPSLSGASGYAPRPEAIGRHQGSL